MKIPKTFIPEKDLEERIKRLTEEHKKREEPDYTDYIIDEEAEELFPNFIEHLKNEYSILYVPKVSGRLVRWVIFSQDTNGDILKIGAIKSFVESKGTSSMYGYKAEIQIKGAKHCIVYRVGYHAYDTNGKVVSSKDPARYDLETLIPFP